ncbi:jg21491 [Pararge aegeria aegeria]|uniref:Jg21491 protein n=1 Tax=Pararge aegeria aegeria TaxID=348720 RepID=A0A8S4RMB2_9NEOP|nr:jg21491 [Pararge aegeria aegeria]
MEISILRVFLRDQISNEEIRKRTRVSANDRENYASAVDIAGLRFVFLINQELISAIRQEAVKVTIPV